MGALYAIGATINRADLSFGVESNLWLGNLIAPGVAIDLVYTVAGSGVDLQSQPGLRASFEPHIAMRFARQGETSAWAFRLAPLYDTAYRWGVRFAVTLQLGGVE